MIVSAHQPAFFPYEGTLSKIRASDRFVVLAHAQFERGNYHNRFNLGEKWLTMSVSQKLQPLIEKRYNRPHEDYEAIKRKIPAHARTLTAFDDCIHDGLVETNVAILRRLCDLLDIKTEIVMDYPTDLKKTERLLDLCRRYGATTYLSGPSGPKYMDLSLFTNIRVDVHQPAGHRAAVELLESP